MLRCYATFPKTLAKEKENSTHDPPVLGFLFATRDFQKMRNTVTP